MSPRGWTIARIAARFMGVLAAIQERGPQLVNELEEGARALRASVRAEVRCAVNAFAMSLIAAACALVALGFLAAAIMLAVGEAHRVLAATLLAAAFALVALWANLSVRVRTKMPPPTDRR